MAPDTYACSVSYAEPSLNDIILHTNIKLARWEVGRHGPRHVRMQRLIRRSLAQRYYPAHTHKVSQVEIHTQGCYDTEYNDGEREKKGETNYGTVL
jgi:hypothetical protein